MIREKQRSPRLHTYTTLSYYQAEESLITEGDSKTERKKGICEQQMKQRK